MTAIKQIVPIFFVLAFFLANSLCFGADAQIVPIQENIIAITPDRVAYGSMGVTEFLDFLNGGKFENPLAGHALPIVLLLTFLGGLAMNLTPCVLPLMPVTLMVIGASPLRGILYATGMSLSYGALGLLAAMGGIAFGTLQGNPFFNGFIAILFAMLALALFGVFHIDFSHARTKLTSGAKSNFANLAFPFFTGCISALLAGACVAPMLMAVLILTADLSAKGSEVALVLPFIFGIGMALPWPLAAAGLKILPKPGAWMTKVNKLFALVVLLFSAWYAVLSVKGFLPDAQSTPSMTDENIIDATPQSFDFKSYPKPLLIDCWASWCKNCTIMEKTTFADERVKDELKKWTILRLQAEDLKELKKIPLFKDLKGIPAFFVFEK